MTVGYSQSCDTDGKYHERVLLKQLPGVLMPEGVLFQADVRQIQKPVLAASGPGPTL